jgi:hypothetical protein
MHHSDIYITSYGRKKNRESKWQFDFGPLKVGNQPDLGVCRWSATHSWKALEESYKFAQGTTIDQNVIYVENHKVIKPFPKNVIHETTKCGGCIGEPKGHHQELL